MLAFCSARRGFVVFRSAFGGAILIGLGRAVRWSRLRSWRERLSSTPRCFPALRKTDSAEFQSTAGSSHPSPSECSQ